jgi:D-cysteine desulfhydrase
MSTRELFRQYPQTQSLPHVELANLPTPVKELSGAKEELGFAGLQMKRDDLTSTVYGGNKVRKLEFLLADAREQGFDEVWTVGTIGSHHVLATCIWAQELEMSCGVLHFPQLVTDHVRKNIRALSTAHPTIDLLSTEFELTKELFKRKMSAWHEANPDTYYIPAGGTTPLGTVGYVNAALEFARQVEEGEAERPDRIYIAAGTCGSFAGLILGFAMADFDVEVVGVQVSALFLANEVRVSTLIDRTATLLESTGLENLPRIEPQEIRMNHGEFGDGYGLPTAEGLHARDLLARTDDLALEPTYTAKAFAAIIADRAEIKENDMRVLYWHTLNGADLSDRVANADLDRLPPEYREWVESDSDGMSS